MNTTPKDNTPDELDEILEAVKNSGHGFQLENGQRRLQPREAKQKLRDYIAREIAEVIGENEIQKPEYTTSEENELLADRNDLRVDLRQRAADRGWRIES